MGEDMEPVEPPYIASANVKCYNHYGKPFGSFLKSETPIMWPKHFTSRNLQD